MRRILVAALLLAGCQTTPAVIEPTPGNVAAQFADVTFGTEFGVGRGTLQRWETRPSIWVHIDGDFDPRPFIKQGDAADREAGRLTRLPVRYADDLASATLTIGFVARRDFRRHLPETLFTDWSDYERFITTSACLGVLAHDEDPDVISGALVLIATDIPKDQMRHCVVEELIQIRGLANDACHYRPSLFCERDRVYAMTEADKILLRVLYHPDLEPGMSRQEAMPIARRLIREMMR